MAKLLVIYTNDDHQSWVVNLDEKTVSEIECDSVQLEEACLLEGEAARIVNLRSDATSHGFHVVQ
jgi:hypothetical protein